jgi:hypothetical protein
MGYLWSNGFGERQQLEEILHRASNSIRHTFRVCSSKKVTRPNEKFPKKDWSDGNGR